jgi:hypothetical protein
MLDRGKNGLMPLEHTDMRILLFNLPFGPSIHAKNEGE